MQKLTVIFIAFILFALTSCEREAKNIDPPTVESQLVVFAFLSPEETLNKVEVSMSRPVFGKYKSQSTWVTNATVTITNDAGFSATMVYSDSANGYILSTSQYPIEAGRSYKVSVSANQKSAYGTTTVPSKLIIPSEIDYHKRTDASGSYYHFAYKWMDEPSHQNFYRTSLESEFISVDFLGDTSYYNTEICSNVFNDENRDGQQLSGVCDDYNLSYNLEQDTSLLPIHLYLLNTDIHYYEYHKRRLNYYGDDPFSEPLQQYSNMNGGLGVVCSYRKTLKRI
jgi:hypothetical protein